MQTQLMQGKIMRQKLMSLHLMRVQLMHVHILLAMPSLPCPGGALSAARSFFTPPTVTPVSGPASWFAAQRLDDAPEVRTSRSLADAPAGHGGDVEAFDLDPDADLGAPSGTYDQRVAPADRTTTGTGA
jgi:hypothetical protein